MARVTVVQRARIAPGRCEKCGVEIKPGEGYKWVQPRTHPGARGHKRVRCARCPSWQPWELSTSRLADVWRAQAEFDDAISGAQSVDDVQTALDELCTAINEVADGYTESADAMEEGFGHSTSTSEELREKADALSDWAATLESIDIPDDEEYAQDCAACDGTGECATCFGTGELGQDNGLAGDCPDCGGSKECPTCEGNPEEFDADAWLAAVADACSEAQDCPV